jgi:ABC-type antimicrobial peptide transport system permease subunit
MRTVEYLAIAGVMVAALVAVGPVTTVMRCWVHGVAVAVTRAGRLSWIPVASHAALSVLLIGIATVVSMALTNLRGVSPGFSEVDALWAELRFPTTLYGRGELSKTIQAQSTLLKELRGLTWVASAGAIVTGLPMRGDDTALEVTGVEGATDTVRARISVVSPGYFETLGIALSSGRRFEERDADLPRVIVSRGLARRLFGGDDAAVGRRIGLPFQNGVEEIIGVVADVRSEGLRSPAPPMVYLSYERAPGLQTTIVARTQGGLGTARELSRALREIAPMLVLTRAGTMRDVMDEDLGDLRLAALGGGGMAAVGFGVALGGVFATLSAVLRGRRREMAIRSALGADRGVLMRYALKRVALPGAVGVPIGLVVLALLRALLASQLHGTPEPAWLAVMSWSACATSVGVATIAVVAGRSFIPDVVKELRIQ